MRGERRLQQSSVTKLPRKRRPNANDRELADVFRKLVYGAYDLTVERPPVGLSLARLKHEGSFDISMPDGKMISIVPRRVRTAA